MTQKDWTGNTQSVMATLNASSHSESERAVHDYYATPAKAVTGLLEEFTFTGPIWEPACGEMHISNILQTAGYTVRSSDLIDRGGHEVLDFLACTTPWCGDIITNPPFALATEFTRKALDLIAPARSVALFLRIQFLEGVRRSKLFATDPPKYVMVASRTLRCAKNGDFASATGNASTYAWFVWEKGFSGDPSILWFN